MKKIIAVVLMLLSSGALAHDWYPQDCCSGEDCHPVPCEEIRMDDFGYYWKGIHFTWAMDRGPSPDGGCHVCITGEHSSTMPGAPYPHCIFTGGVS